MARPTKQGIDFFSLDVNNDDKLDLFIAETGAEGFGILVMLWQLIYRGEGYFISADNDLVLLLRKRSFSTPETIQATISAAVNRKIFDENLYSAFGILTSTGIQKRYFQAARKKKEVTVKPEFLLISVSDYKNTVSDAGNPVIVDGNATKEKEKEKEKEYSLREVEVSDTAKDVTATTPFPAGYGKHPQKYFVSPYRPEAEKFAEWFALNLRPPSIDDNPTNRAAWSLVWYQLRETDQRQNVDEMLHAIRWARKDPFWMQNFLSPLKLRTKDPQGMPYMDRIINDYKRHNKTGGHQNGRNRKGLTEDQFAANLDWLKNHPGLQPAHG